MFESEETVSFAEFVQELQGELEYHQKGSHNNYRMVSAELSLKVAVANQVDEFSLFLNRDIVKEMVAQLPEINLERRSDVEKMLSTIARDLFRKATQSDEVKKYVEQKRQNRKPLQFKNK